VERHGVNGDAAHPESTSTRRPLAAIILAAGKGTRMNSELPKVVHRVAGRPMVWWVVDAVRRAGAAPIVLVVGHGAESVQSVFDGDDGDLAYVVQAEQLGTGHATQCAEPALAEFDGDVLVLAGDGPLIRHETLQALCRRHQTAGAVATLATSVVEDPAGYGRVIRNAGGRFEAIVEHKNASPAQRAIREIYPSYACFDAVELFRALKRLEPDALTGEYYITDVPAMLRSAGGVVEVIDAVPPEDVLSINTLTQLAEVDAILRSRVEVVGP
jgi:bifunctional UDP-N-acetylglucosamine pyrophosphorylase/glucosamine-1-phosphate N-acetyltransferase